jgi:hypothetical protein
MRVFKKQRKKPQISRAEALKCTPVISAQVVEDRLESGTVIIRYPVTIRPFFATWVKRFGGPDDYIQTPIDSNICRNPSIAIQGG